MKALQAPMGYSFSSFPITPPRPRFCRVIRAQVPKLQLSRKQFCLMSIIQVGTGENVLQKHAAFFDRNNDGIVYPWETFEGFRAIGSNIPLSLAASVIINVGLSQNTRPGKFPSLLFPIEVNNIAKAKHGSDTGVYDTEGRFVPSKFEAIFSKHARTNPNALTSEELDEMLKANREKKDFQGWFGAWVEWRVLYFLCKDKNGLLQKDTIRASYDGSLFEKMQSEQLVKHKT